MKYHFPITKYVKIKNCGSCTYWCFKFKSLFDFSFLFLFLFFLSVPGIKTAIAATQATAGSVQHQILDLLLHKRIQLLTFQISTLVISIPL